MNGLLAILYLAASLSDMKLSDCPTGCLAEAEVPSRVSIRVAKVEFQREIIGDEVYVGYDWGKTYGPFQPTIGVSANDQNALWIGAGTKWTSTDLLGGPVFLEASFMPGFLTKGDGPDIGGAFHFRSSLGVGYEFDNGATILASYDHRSNGDLRELNPGLETIGVRFAFPF